MGISWFVKGRNYVQRMKPQILSDLNGKVKSAFTAKVKPHLPQFMSKNPHWTFISLHYIFVTGMTFIGSILLYPKGNLQYIDALFFASGCATQSGLNTVDINLLSTYQQVVLLIIAMMCNPIAINTFVVFLRLYWFEKKFQEVAMEAKKHRRTISRSRSQAAGDLEKGLEHRGVNGRSIVVMHDTSRPIPGDGAEKDDFGKIPPATEDGKGETSESSGPGSDRRSSETPRNDQPTTYQQPSGITFADQVKRSDGMSDEAVRLPAPMSNEDHLRILEKQRNPEDKGVLRIPGPRDAEAGRIPERVDENESRRDLARRESSHEGARKNSEDSKKEADDEEQTSGNQEPRRIVIQEPIHPHNQSGHHRKEHMAQDLDAAGHAAGILRFRKPKIFRRGKEDETHSMSRPRAMSFSTFKTALTHSKGEEMPYLSWQATVGRNSQFADLTEEQREELGGCEYRSLKTLSNGLLLYFWGYTIFGIIGLCPWILTTSYGAVVTKDGQGRPWWAIFTAVSAFTDLGFTLTPDSMISFQDAVWPLLLISFLIVIGNTGFPIMLRFLIYLLSKIVPPTSALWEELRFLLDHPRRCFALLFPAGATWWLLIILVILNGIDLVLFIILDLGNTVVTQLPTNIKVLDGFFQAISTRTAGFGVVNLAALHPGIQVSYLIMMYISVLPIAMSVRRTNVYEENSLGIYGSPHEETEDENEPSYIGAHLRRQLSFDLWYIFLGFFVIAIAEGSRIQDESDVSFSMFAVLFEIVSAYGTVGLSLGYPTINASFSAEFNVVSKLVIIAMQIRGRHRGLPYDLDQAILLKGELVREKEEQIESQRIRRRGSMATVGTTSGAAFGPYLNGANGSRTEIGDNRRRDSSLSRSKPSRSRTFEKVPEFFSGLLRPGPTMPNVQRRGDGFERPRRSRSVSELGNNSRERGMSVGDDIAGPEDRIGGARKMSGRRNFHVEGLNDG